MCESGLQLRIVGTGGGATYIYDQESSSAFVVLRDGVPLLLCDVGYGVTAACIQLLGRVPPHLYISHNHGDHSGELPVVLAVESKAAAAEGRGPPELYAHPDVLHEVRQYRLRELRSTGQALEDFATFHEVPCDRTTPIGDTGLAIRPFRTRHSETCYGGVLYDGGRAVLGWTADSGYDQELYDQLAGEGPWTLLVDARARGTAEHAGFDEVARLAGSPAMAGRAMYVTGYGRQDEAPGPDDVGGAHVARPGDRIPLSLQPQPPGGAASDGKGPAAVAAAAAAGGDASDGGADEGQERSPWACILS